MGEASFIQVYALLTALGWLLILVLLRMVFRSDRIAVVALVLVVAPLTTQPGNHLALEIVIGTLITRSLVGLLRFGLLSLVVELTFSSALFFLPISLDPSDWYQPRSVVVLLGLGAIVTYGAYTSMESRRVLVRNQIAG